MFLLKKKKEGRFRDIFIRGLGQIKIRVVYKELGIIIIISNGLEYRSCDYKIIIT